MKSVRLKIITVVLLVCLVLCTLMWLFHALFFLREPEYLGESPAQFWGVVGVLLLGFSILLFIFSRPLERTYRKVSSGETIAPTEGEKARRVIRVIPVMVIVTNIIGFFLGPIISSVVSTLVTGKEVQFLPLALTIFYTLPIGCVSALQSIYLINIILLPVKKRFNITSLGSLKKGLSFRTKNLLLSLSCVLFTLSLFMTAGFGFYREELNNSFEGGTSIVQETSGEAAGGIGELSSSAELALKGFVAEMFLLGVVVVVIVAATLYIVLKEQEQSIQHISDNMEKAGGAEGDLSQRLPIVQNDDLGRLANYINLFLDKLEELLFRVKNSSERVADSSRILKQSADQVEASAVRVSQALARVKINTESQLKSVRNTEGAIESMLDSISDVSNQVETQASFVAQSSAAITEMTANISSVSSTTRQAENLSRKLLSVAEEGRGAVEVSVKAIREIEDSSSKVESIVSVISKIAAQTNMLAMNAAIEAAHAGESGRGFAVVADEVRKLAENSSRNAREITEHIKDMTIKIKSGVERTEKAGEAFKQLVSIVGDTTRLTNTISAAMEEQQLGAQEILTSINTLVEATEEIKKLSLGQRDKSLEMKRALEELVGASGQIETAVLDQIENNSEINSVIGELKTISEKNTLVVEDLKKMLGLFRLREVSEEG